MVDVARRRTNARQPKASKRETEKWVIRAANI
jgi:hypothetical protein